jgi:hypothetical protein
LSKAHTCSEVLVSHGNARLTVHGRKLIVDRCRVASTKVVCDGPGDQRALHVKAATA